VITDLQTYLAVFAIDTSDSRALSFKFVFLQLSAAAQTLCCCCASISDVTDAERVLYTGSSSSHQRMSPWQRPAAVAAVPVPSFVLIGQNAAAATCMQVHLMLLPHTAAFIHRFIY